MDKTLIILGALTLGLIAAIAGMVVTSFPLDESPTTPLTLAKRFVMEDPTFKFDGMPETLKASLEESGDPVMATVEFTSRHAGYGDRTGMMLAQVLTPHKCILKISGGQVQSAVMDGRWDMITQKELKQ